jgi:hypothetical protein
MNRGKAFSIISCLAMALLAPGGSAWTACTQADYYCDIDDAVRAGSGTATKSGVYGYNNGAGWGVFGRTTSGSGAIQAGVGGENLGTGPGVYGHGLKGVGVYGVSESISSAGIEGKNLNGGVALQGYTTSVVPSSYPAIQGHNYGAGPGISGSSLSGEGVQAFSTNSSGIKAGSVNDVAGYFELNNGTNTKYALVAKNLYGSGISGQGKTSGVYGTATSYGVRGVSASGMGAYFTNTSATTTKPALRAQTAGKGYAAEFRSSNALAPGGVYIKTNGTDGIIVEGGTKNALVPTSQGKRALYAEESSEVYFSDYGFGRLKDGKAVIPIDPLFAETVNVQQPYHVFVQAYGRAELYVSKRTPEGFEVALNKGDANVEFSYRLVAKRRGFETARLGAVPSPPEGKTGPYAEEPEERVAALNAMAGHD